MVEQARSWLKENSTLVLFLIAQLIALGAASAAIIAYSVKLETRVTIMETRGAEYTVARMAEMQQRITVLEQKIDKNAAQIERLVNEFIKQLQQKPP
jgi:uncharacterized coiled-coil protein SlyX